MMNRIDFNNYAQNSKFDPYYYHNYKKDQIRNIDISPKLPQILFISSFPPRECGIATYSMDLIKSIQKKFEGSFEIKICPIETNSEKYCYSDDPKYFLNSDESNSFYELADSINDDFELNMVIIQHEFGFFRAKEQDFRHFLRMVNKPKIVVFHTVLPNPDSDTKENVMEISKATDSIIVMTNASKYILENEYNINPDKISVIAHGTHLVANSDKEILKEKYDLKGRLVLSTFGLLSKGKNIETTLDALQGIVEIHPEVIFLIIGITHPTIVKHEGESYRKFLESKIETLSLMDNVRFINSFLSLPVLLEYLQLTDIYLFTSNDPFQAVSGTFSYAVSCGCPVISTPIPHAKEILKDNKYIIDFSNSKQLEYTVNSLLSDTELRKNISSEMLHTMAPSAWENSAIGHALLFERYLEEDHILSYSLPDINLHHIKKMTTEFGIVQFSKINHPDIESGYTLDDNARALIAICMHYENTKDNLDIELINTYLIFIVHCLQENGSFLNYVNENNEFTKQNFETNLEDSNGRAIWALGYMISIGNILPKNLIAIAESTLEAATLNIERIHSPRAMSFIIKGLYFNNTFNENEKNIKLITLFADRLMIKYINEIDINWNWYESYMTYGNSIIPEAMLLAYMSTGEIMYKEAGKSSFEFLLSKIFYGDSIKVISNKGWLHKNSEPSEIIIKGGEQPIDVAYTIMALKLYYQVFKQEKYKIKMKIAFDWFLGKNHLNQIIYNPCTGGCYDGLEDEYVNLNQGAESTVSYLMARMTVEKFIPKTESSRLPKLVNLTLIQD